MITLELNNHIIENHKAVQNLKELGFDDQEIQKLIDKQNVLDEEKENTYDK